MKILLFILLSFALALVCSWTAFQTYSWWSFPVCLFAFMGSGAFGIGAFVAVMERLTK